MESLDRSPKKNWVENAGGLPGYIENIANDIHDQGHTISSAISIAVAMCKRWCSGRGNVKADTRTKACAAVAEWEAKKAGSHLKSAAKSATHAMSSADLVRMGADIVTVDEAAERLEHIVTGRVREKREVKRWIQ